MNTEILKSRDFVLFERTLLFIVLPLIGILIPALLRLFEEMRITKVFFSYLFSISITYSVWLGCRTVFIRLRFKSKSDTDYRRFIISYGMWAVLYSFVISYVCFSLWFNQYLHFKLNFIFLALIASFFSVLISALYEIILLHAQNHIERANNIKLRNAKQAVEIHYLNAKIDPHFLFNSLSTLQNLIIENKEAANEFNKNLSELYYHQLTWSKENYVCVQKELTMMYKYLHLISIRFPGAIQVSVIVQDFQLAALLIPPLSLQLLLENAVKHNAFSIAKPLIITITVSSRLILFHNKKNKAIHQKQSSKNGLKILAERFKILFHRDIVVTSTDDFFEVQLPIKKQKT